MKSTALDDGAPGIKLFRIVPVLLSVWLLLVILHTWRLPGSGFLLLYAFDVLPGLFAWLAGGGDILVATGALILGVRLLQGRQVKHADLQRRNAFGLLDFLVAVGVGTALRSGDFGGLVSTDVMASLPLSLIPP